MTVIGLPKERMGGTGMSNLELLKQYFGYDRFREGQEYLIDSIQSGRDCLGIMPTGAGKSICFQIPALSMDGITIIVSPLISLMKDQVNALTQAGIPAAFINSSLTERQIALALDHARNGAYRLIYVAPERLFASDFLAFAQSVCIAMLTVDEAHCISQWGQDFRPSYAKIPTFIAQLSSRPVVSAFTATATPRVREDIVDLLNLRDPAVLVTSFNRENLSFEVQKPQDKFGALTDFLADKKSKSGIVYCSTRSNVEEVCERLCQSGYDASRYHAGLSDKERHQNQDDFLYDRAQIMVATNAFGMGIDKSNVSFVVHYNMPRDIESYYQEAGRAGRDGQPADCLLLYSGQDVRTQLWLIENADQMEYPDQETEERLKERERKRLREMTFFCTTNHCLRAYLLSYFGETPPTFCGNCGSCNSNYETVDVTIDAQKILSCVYRMKERYGMQMIIGVLRGSKNEKILRLGLDKLSTYGISEKSEQQLRDMMNDFLVSGLLQKTDDAYPVIRLGPRANAVLRGGEQVIIKLPKQKENDHRSKAQEQQPVRPVDKDLFAVLRDLRLHIASEQKVPAFVIFSDSTLTDMCMKNPQTPEEMLGVSGVGQKKLEQYGERFLQAIVQYHAQNPQTETTDTDPPAPFALDKTVIAISDEPVTISAIADQINSMLIQIGGKKVSGAKINDWLIEQGFLEKYTENGKNYKIPTAQGQALEITNEQRIIRGEPSRVNFYGKAAQQWIVERLEEIVPV